MSEVVLIKLLAYSLANCGTYAVFQVVCPQPVTTIHFNIFQIQRSILTLIIRDQNSSIYLSGGCVPQHWATGRG